MIFRFLRARGAARLPATVALWLLAGIAAAPMAHALSYTEALAQLSTAHDKMRDGDPVEAKAILDDLIETVPREEAIDPELRGDIIASAMAELAGIAWQKADGARAASLMQASINAYGDGRLKQLASDYVLQHLALAAMHAQAGAFDEADRAYQKAKAHIAVMMEAQVNNQMAFQIVFKREMTRAYIDLRGEPGEQGIANTASATRIADAIGTPYAAVHRLTEAFALGAAGRFDEAAVKADDAAAGGLPFGRDYVSRAMLFRAGALGTVGKRDDALKLARAAEAYAESNDAQVAVLQLLADLDAQTDDAAWPVRFDPSSDSFFMALVPRMRLSSQVLERGDTRLPRPLVNIGYAFDFVPVE